MARRSEKAKIGDEVSYKINNNPYYFWVTYIESDWGYVAGIDMYGQVHTAREYTRTGRRNNSLAVLVESLQLRRKAPNGLYETKDNE